MSGQGKLMRKHTANQKYPQVLEFSVPCPVRGQSSELTGPHLRRALSLGSHVGVFHLRVTLLSAGRGLLLNAKERKSQTFERKSQMTSRPWWWKRPHSIYPIMACYHGKTSGASASSFILTKQLPFIQKLIVDIHMPGAILDAANVAVNKKWLPLCSWHDFGERKKTE